jgi:hypothetical protein
MHLVQALYEDPTSLQADYVRTYIHKRVNTLVDLQTPPNIGTFNVNGVELSRPITEELI